MTPTVAAYAGSYSRLAPSPVEPGEEGTGAGDDSTLSAGPAGQLPVRRDQLDAALPRLLQVGDYAVVGRIAAGRRA